MEFAEEGQAALISKVGVEIESLLEVRLGELEEGFAAAGVGFE